MPASNPAAAPVLTTLMDEWLQAISPRFLRLPPQIGNADGRPEEIVFVALAQDKATYRNLAEMPEQEAWCRRFAERLKGNVHWEDVEMEMAPS